ncbi:DEAD/DEAH box helicase [Nonomuraea sp. LPB2021202275-12-8]|uniref:DEAD/DEAH box helicase n=1 Tax=Nonomuraea sp. LPB2021202275-12-8 TaxID=3120159 RepID=UPI00300C55B3
MSTVPVFLTTGVAVVPSPKVYAKLAQDTHPLALVQEMDDLARAGALPARVDDGRLAVYTSRYVAWLYPSRQGDAYSLGGAAPRRFRDEERLVEAALLLRCQYGWHAYHHLRDVPAHGSAHWDLLLRAWSQAAAPSRPASPLPPAHTLYLDLMSQVIEAGRDIEVTRQHDADPLLYRNKASTREQRHSVRDVYTFRLLRAADVPEGTVLYLRESPDLRGRVLRVRDLDVTIRFERAVDYGRIPAAGALMTMPSDRIYQAQADAVARLRDGRSVNAGLLHQLVDRRVAPFQPHAHARPREPLDEGSGQLAAFQRALAVPDLLLVLGPPGTGKTRTIAQIVAACAGRQRVLVTSHTNRAVDNVLEKLPEDVFTVRIGNEDKMTAHARTLMVENRVQLEQRRVLAATEGTEAALRPFAGSDSAAGHWLSYLDRSLDGADAADTQARRLAAEREAAVARATAPLAGRLEAAGSAAAGARATAQALDDACRRARDRYEAGLTRARSGLLAFLWRWVAGRRLLRSREAEQAAAVARAESDAASTALAAVREEADRLAEADPAANELARAVDAAAGRRRAELAQAEQAASMVRSMITAWLPLDPAAPGADLSHWRDERERLARATTQLAARAELLTAWRAGIAETGEELQHELVRYATVVGATCIGTATAEILADLEFDLVIVDEAGQISTPNLLVPLVRGRRALLVGDHHQLPPYLDEEVSDWAAGLRADAELPQPAIDRIGDILRRSAFEQLYGTLPEDHQVMLRLQRRMPREIAEFVSAAFYGGILRTEHPGGGRDPIFRSPFAMIDTSDLPDAERREEELTGEAKGYRNRAEADLIARLVRAYAPRYKDWAVIVPYKAQAELIRSKLGGGTDVAGHVDTVDSFQGGERDLVVYGFTRSNAQRKIGFLKELRRLNVAISRARAQLVVVGDQATLTRAREPEFARLARAMIAHLGRVGDLRPSREAGRLIDEIEEA